MEEKNSFDWLAVTTQASDKSFTDIYSLGVDPSNTTLESKEFYKKSNKIQQMPAFQTEGKFDSAKFDAFYLSTAKSFNEYKKADFDLGNATLDMWEDTSVARALKAPIRKNPVKVSLTSKDPFTNLKQAQGSFYGITEINKWTKPTKTLSEVAQGLNVIDGATGKELDYKPEDTGLFNLYGFFDEPLVMSQYDIDIKDDKGKIVHKKGEYKFDENGLPRFETLAGRDVAGKQLLSKMDTLTKEGSYANKLDFMDSDGFDKSLTGLVVKSAVEIAPFIIGGPISNLYKAYYITSGLIDGTSEIYKALDGILNGPEAKKGAFYKFANTLQGYTGQQKSGLSEAGREKFYGLESLASMAVDSVYQLMGQKAIAQWPSDIKKYQMAKSLGLNPRAVLNSGDEATSALLNAESYLAKYGDDWVKSAQAMSNNVATLEKYAKYSSYISTAYMAATSAVGISQVSETAGLDARDKGFMYLGYMGALVPLFRSDVGRWVEKGLEVDHLARGINKATLSYAERYLPQALKETGEIITDRTLKGRALQAMAAGKGLGDHIRKLFTDLDVNTIGTAALAEGTEEVTEQMLQQALQGVYNGLASAGIKSTQADATFDLNPADMAADLLANAVGGALGGAVFKSIDRSRSPIFKSNNMMEYVTQGYAPKVIEKINQLKNAGQLGDTGLSTTPLTELDGTRSEGMWQPVNADNPISQNEFIADRMIKAVKVIEGLRKGYNIHDPNVTAEEKNQFFNTIVDTKTDTDLRDRINSTATQIYELAQEIQNVDDLEAENEEGMLDKKARLKILKTQLEYLQGDDSTDEYFKQGLFNIRTDINQHFGVKNRQTFTEDLIGKRKTYRSLNEEDKLIVDNAFEAYKLDETATGIKSDLYKARLEWERFNTNMEKKGFKQLESFKQSMLDLNKFAKSGRLQYVPDDPNVVVAEMPYHQLMNDYLNNLEGVEYIPDFMYDQIKEDMKTLASRGAAPYLAQFAPSASQFKESIQRGLKNMETSTANPFIKGFLEKTFGGTKYDEFINSIEFKDLLENKANASDYNLLKVLKIVADNEKLDNSLADYRLFNNEIDQLSDDDITDLLNGIEFEASHPASAYLVDNGFVDFIQRMAVAGNDLQDILELAGDATNLVKQYAMYKFLADRIGEEISDSDLFSYVGTTSPNNILLDLLLKGKYDDGDNSLQTATIREQDTTALDAAVDQANKFDKTRVKSPLRDVLRGPYEFADSEMDNMTLVGPSNYLNSSEEFEDSLDGHLNAIERVGALIEASNTMNPLINDFRKNNRAILPEELKGNPLGIELTELGNEEKSMLFSELNYLRARIQYLKDVNEYNKNNILQKLLREDGLILASSVQTLKKISADGDVIKLLPTLGTLYNVSSIIDYSSNPKLASAELKKQAIYDMANFEHGIYEDFQKLSKEDQLRVVNLTFKPVSKDDSSFYDQVDGTAPFNDSMQTIYLAKIYGTSTLGFYSRYAGEFEDGGFEHIKNSEFIPFASQEGAIRLADLMINGNSDVMRYLFNAYTWADQDEDSPKDYSSRPGNSSFANFNTVTIWGDPGTGKTTAVLTNIINLLQPGEEDVLLLAPEQRQLDGLKDSILRSAHAERVSIDYSSTFKDLLPQLGLKDRNGKALDILSKQSEWEAILSKPDNATALYSAYNTLINDIFANLNIYKAKSDVSSTLNPEIISFLSQFKLIAIDEYTHIPPVELGILTRLIQEFNSSTTVQNDPSKKISIINLGDVNQMGYLISGTRRDFTSVSDTVTSQPLTTTLRSGWDLINNTLVDIRRRAVGYRALNSDELQKSELISEALSNPIKTSYSLSKDGNVGFQHVQKTGETSVEDLKFITENKHLFPTDDGKKSVVYIVNDDGDVAKAEALLKTAIGDGWRSFVDIYTPKQVQGGEYKYAIVDAHPSLNGNGYDMKRAYEFLNTMFSRATEATLFLNDGSIDPFAKFQNEKKEKAIKQIKINDEIKQKVKLSKQEALEAILRDFVPQETPGEVAAEQVDASKPTLPVVNINKLLPLFEAPVSDIQPSTAKSGDVISYNTFSTVADYDTIFKLAYPDENPRLTSQYADQINKIIASYKYYLLHKDEIGDNRISLKENFQYLFEGNYDYDNPTFYLEASKRGEDGLTVGRSELGKPSKQTADDIIISLKVKLASEQGFAPIVLTMGMLNQIDGIITKHNQRAAKDNNSAKIASIFQSVNTYLKGQGEAPKVGSTDQGVWRSSEFSENDLKGMSEIFRSRILLGGNEAISFRQFKENYPDFMITEPQVVVATLIDDANEDVLNRNNSNPRYKEIWNDLKGKSVAFVSEIYELQSLPPHRLLEIYMKQLELFNDPAFKLLDKEGKENYIINKQAEGMIKIGEGPAAIEIAYKPNLVKMIKLDNPKGSFLEFRERFIAEVSLAAENKRENIQEGFKRFDMPVYVKDRLIKSLITLRQMLDITETRKWFETNVLPLHSKNVENRLTGIKQALLEEYGEEFENITADDLSVTRGSWINTKSELTTDEFIAKLDNLLFDKDTKVIVGLYDTGDTNRTKGAPIRLKEDISDKDLRLKLSTDKQKDFSSSILQVNSFNLLFKTKNLNFAELIDLSLTALASLKPEDKMDKYDLSSVFKEGKIESVVIPTKKASDSGTDFTSNVLAEARQYGNGFTFNFEGLQLASYNINFDKLLKFIDPTTSNVAVASTTLTANAEAPVEVVDNTIKELYEDYKLKFAGIQNKAFQDMFFNETPASMELLDALKSSIPVGKFLPNTGNKNTLVENSVIGYNITADDTYEEVVLDQYILSHLDSKSLVPEDGENGPVYSFQPSSGNSSTTWNGLVTVNGANFDVNIKMPAAIVTATMLPSAVETENPMDKIRQIEKDELKKFDEFVEANLQEMAKEQAVKDYVEMNKQLYRHTVVTTNLLATGGTLAEYDAQLANYNVEQQSSLMSQHFQANRAVIRKVRPQLEALTVLMKQYKTNIC